MHLCRDVCCIYVLLLWVDLVYVQTSGLQAQSTVSHISRTQQSSEGGSNDTTGSVSTGSRLSEGQVTPQPGGKFESLQYVINYLCNDMNLMRLSGCYQLLAISDHSLKAFTNEASVIPINHPVDPSYGERKAVWQIMPSDEIINSAAIVV